MRSPSDPPARDMPSQPTAAAAREARRKVALLANMARRKAQAKARSAEDAPGDNENKG